jgi:glutamine amidotransferase
MCRLLGYIGASIQLDRVLYKPKHSLVVQSYQPLEMTAGLVNADGFGVGWYHPKRQDHPYAYRNVLPIWNDTNLQSLSRYVESPCIVASVRSATPGLAVNLNNCPPFQYDHLMMVHNGFIENFRQTLYRPLRDRLSDEVYGSIEGSTDSEHLFALIRQQYHTHPQIPLEDHLRQVLSLVYELAERRITVGANLILSDGDRLIACRASNRETVPTLYWLADDAQYPGSVLVASEPLFPGKWQPVPEHSLLIANHALNVDIQPIF